MCTWLLGNYRLLGNDHLICDGALGNAQPCPSKGLVFPYIPSMISAWVCSCVAFKSNKEMALKQLAWRCQKQGSIRSNRLPTFNGISRSTTCGSEIFNAARRPSHPAWGRLFRQSSCCGLPALNRVVITTQVDARQPMALSVGICPGPDPEVGCNGLAASRSGLRTEFCAVLRLFEPRFLGGAPSRN